MIRRDDPLVLAHAILGVTDRLARVLVLEQGRPADEAGDAAVAFCLEGILSPAAAQQRAGSGQPVTTPGRGAMTGTGSFSFRYGVFRPLLSALGHGPAASAASSSTRRRAARAHGVGVSRHHPA